MKPESKPSLSAIVPITNYFQHKNNIEKIITHCLSKNVELILVLDKQSSESQEDLIKLIKPLKELGIVIQSDSGNPGGARNAGIDSANGKWITFWDCDDEPQIDKVMELISTPKNADFQVLVGSYQAKNIGDHKMSTLVATQANWEINLGLNPGIWRFVFRRDVIREIRFPEARMGEDQIFLQRIFSTDPEVILSEDITYIYKTNVPNQLTGERRNLNDLVMVNRLSTLEFDLKAKYSLFSRTMIARQLLTLTRYENLGIIARLGYLAKVANLFARNPIILFTLVNTIRKPKTRTALK